MNASCRSTNECGSNLVCSSERCQCASKDDFWDNESCMRSKFVSKMKTTYYKFQAYKAFF